MVTHWPALAAAVLAPFLIGAIFLRAPILPTVAIEVDPGPTVVRGHVITVDDRMTTLLDESGSVQFVLNESVRSKVLCPDLAEAPASTFEVRGWAAEQTAL